jgi:hypothetical protein
MLFVLNVWGFLTEINFLAFVYSHLSNFSAIQHLSPLPVTELQIYTHA